jgi:DNA-binding XRE family transcriptional regulator
MLKRRVFSESHLAALAKRFRKESGLKKADVAEQLRVARSTVQQAEENPEQSLTKLRVRMIEACSPYQVRGPVYFLEKK